MGLELYRRRLAVLELVAEVPGDRVVPFDERAVEGMEDVAFP